MDVPGAEDPMKLSDLTDGSYFDLLKAARGPTRGDVFTLPGSDPVPAYEGPQPLRSSCSADDGSATLQVFVRNASAPSPDDPNSRGRGISGQLNDVELVA